MIKYITTINGQEFEIEILEDKRISVNGKIYTVDFEEVTGQLIYTMLIDGHSYEARVSESGDEWQVYMRGTLFNAEVIDEREKRLRAAGGEAHGGSGELLLKAPMPGLVVKVPVKEGDTVKKGDVLVVLESMKMQNELKASQDGKISEIEINEGDSVEQKQILITLSPPEE